MSGPPALSVVLATRNRAVSLDRLLRGLAAQRDAPSYEVVVADNGSSDTTPEVIKRAAEHMAIRGVRVEEPGKGRALNAALRLAAGGLVAFTDDDVVPDEGWLREMHLAAVANPAMRVFGGRIEVDPDAVPGWVRRSHNLMGLLTSEHHAAASVYAYGHYPFGPNMAVRRLLLAGLESPYPEDMGPGTCLPVGDESGFLIRVSPPEARDRMYVPSARVFHQVEPRNVALSTALRRSYQQGQAQGRLGIAAVIPTDSGGGESLLYAAASRLRACGSLREVWCVLVRHAGYLAGVRAKAAHRGVGRSASEATEA